MLNYSHQLNKLCNKHIKQEGKQRKDAFFCFVFLHIRHAAISIEKYQCRYLF